MKIKLSYFRGLVSALSIFPATAYKIDINRCSEREALANDWKMVVSDMNKGMRQYQQQTQIIEEK